MHGEPAAASSRTAAKMRPNLPTVLKISLTAGVIVAAVWLSIIVRENDVVQHLVRDFGYLGLFVASVISGFNLIAPIPIISFTPLFVGSGLSLISTVLIISLGLTAGDALGFWIGYLGREIKTPSVAERVARLEIAREQSTHLPLVMLFLYAAFAPLPNEIMVIPMALAGYRFRQIIPVTLAGNFLFNMLVATGLMGLTERLV